MARVRGFESQQLLNALILIVMVLFVASGAPGAGRWRPALRRAAAVGFIVAVVLAVGELVAWLAGPGP